MAILKKLGAVSLLAFSLLFCGAYNKCEAQKNVTGLVICSNKNIQSELAFANKIISYKLSTTLRAKNILLELTSINKHVSGKTYDILFYIVPCCTHANYINEAFFAEILKAKIAKNIIVCSLRCGMHVTFTEEDKLYFTGYDINHFVTKDPRSSLKHIKVPTENSFGFLYVFINQEDSDYEPNKTSFENLLNFVANCAR